MAGQEQKKASSQEEETQTPDPETPAAPAGGQSSPATEGVDDLLDEIDGVLESNAEEFVRGFVQKGGQ